MPLSGIGLGYAITGGILLWSGVKGETIAATITDLAHGKQPSGVDQQAITVASSPSTASTTAGGGGRGGGGGSVGPPSSGNTYSYGQLKSLWMLAGGPPSLAATMAAIAEAESGGRSNAYNPSGASGLWQILGAVHPADQAHLFDPYVNAREAVAKYRTQGLSAWVTYTSGAYRQYLR